MNYFPDAALSTAQLLSCSFIGPSGSSALLFAGLEGSEGLSELFEYRLKALSPEGELNADDWLGKSLAIQLYQATVNTSLQRILHGRICGFRHVADEGQLLCYEFLLRPWLWFSTCSSNCRIFQNQTVLEVLKSVLAQYPGEVDWAATENYPTLEYCVQFAETDFAFVSRLMEEAGLYYFFRHTAEGHILVITESMSEHQAIEAGDRFRWRSGKDDNFTSLWEWVPQSSLSSGRVSVADFDFTKANTREASVLRAEYSIVKGHDQSGFEHYLYPGYFNHSERGETIAKVQMQALHAKQQRVEATGCAPYLLPGATFTLSEHPEDSQNAEYLIVRATLKVICTISTYGVSAPCFSCDFEAIRSDTRYRAGINTPRPRMSGPQTAFVVGKEGEQLWVDEFGRVKIQFHWDRGQQNNENCSCWVRVAQPLAGQRWGAIFLPRIGQEVIVEFLDGNPDRPLVTGSLYNGGMRPPYELPMQVARSGIKSQSLGAKGVYNELRFEDKSGAEQLLFHAGRNQDITVRNDALEYVGNDQHLKVGGNSLRRVEKDAHEYIGGELNMCAAGDYSLAVGGDLSIEVNGGYSMEVAADHRLKVEGAHSLDVTADSNNRVDGKFKLGASSLDLKGAKTVTIEAGQTLTLKAGSSTLVLGPKGVAINGALVTIDAKGNVDINSGGDSSAESAEAPHPIQTKKATPPQAPKEADNGRD